MPATGVRRRVLFVEDEVALRSAYRRYFEQRYDLAFAGTGADALERLQNVLPGRRGHGPASPGRRRH